MPEDVDPRPADAEHRIDRAIVKHGTDIDGLHPGKRALGGEEAGELHRELAAGQGACPVSQEN